MDVSVADPLLGQVLDGRYEVRSRIARGGMATVYLALDQRLERDVALKVMHTHLADDEEFLRRFTREARSAARLNHPAVVQVFDQSTHGDVVFLAMEYVPGHTLRDLLHEQAPLPVGEALDLLEPVLQALSIAHHAGIVHRDVKPENVLLGEQGQVKVADFGLARTVNAAHSGVEHHQAVLLGTVAYLAPEQVQRGIADPRSDVYAAGVVLFEMLTGAKPFAGDTPVQVALQHVSSRVPAPSSLAAAVPAAVDELVLLATARDPDGRPADAAELLEALRTTRRRLTRPQLAGRAGRAGERAQAEGQQRTVALDVAELQAAAALAGDLDGASRCLRAPRQRASRGLVLLLLVVLLTALLGVGGWYLGIGPGSTARQVASQGPTSQPVPAVVGQPEQQARESLRARSLEVAPVDEQYDATVPAGSVLSVDPAPGTVLGAGAVVRLVVSRGPEPVALPSWAGKSLADARPALVASGLKVKALERFNATVDRGLVVSQSPRRGTARRGDTVTLVVSRGPRMVVVPRVVGKQVSEATERLRSLGFRVEVRKVLGGYFGSVRSQRPGAGQDAPEGSTITLTVV